MKKTIGVISDTHGLMRPEALTALADSELIIHAGDVGKPEILAALVAIAPVVAIKGNIDRGATGHLPETELVECNGARIYIIHDLKDLDVDPMAEGYHVVISGHSHKPALERKSGVLYLNPGAAGQRRFKLPISVAQLIITSGRPTATIIELAV